MATKKKKSETLHKPFLVRILDIEIGTLLEQVEREVKPKMSRNAIVNECLKNWLKIMLENKDPAASLQNIFDNGMTEYRRTIKKDLDSIKTLLLIGAAEHDVTEKAVGYIASQIDHILNSQEIIATLPKAEIEMGKYDVLPKRLSEEKEKAITKLLDD